MSLPQVIEIDETVCEFNKHFPSNDDGSTTISFNDSIFLNFLQLDNITKDIPDEYKKILFDALVKELNLSKEDLDKLVSKIILFTNFNMENKVDLSKYEIIKDENCKIISVIIPYDMILNVLEMQIN